MASTYLYFADKRIFKDGKEGFLNRVPVLPVKVLQVSWGYPDQQFFITTDGTRIDLTDDELAFFSESILAEVNEESFELGDLYIERSSLTSKLESTDYIEEGINNGTLSIADYVGVTNDRATWKARKATVDKRISEIKALAS